MDIEISRQQSLELLGQESLLGVSDSGSGIEGLHSVTPA